MKRLLMLTILFAIPQMAYASDAGKVDAVIAVDASTPTSQPVEEPKDVEEAIKTI